MDQAVSVHIFQSAGRLQNGVPVTAAGLTKLHRKHRTQSFAAVHQAVTHSFYHLTLVKYRGRQMLL